MIEKSVLDRAFDARFAPEIKEKLASASVAVAGLGGLGSNITLMLARSGVGHLFLVDFDTVDPTNLNRQAYGISHLGMPKTQAIKTLIDDINPYLDVKTECVKVTPANVAELFGAYPLVCEAFDKPDQKAMLVRELLTQTASTVVSGNGMAGFGNSNAVITMQINSRLYMCGDGSTDVGGGTGLMAPRVNICAGHQANKIIELILNKD
jgi:sulfur carrier protein ThiS adenylyltransferase